MIYLKRPLSPSPPRTASRLAAASRKRALSTSPFSDLVRNSPAAAAAAAAAAAQPHNPSASAAASVAAANGAASPSSSGSFDALGIPHPLQQAAHLLRGSPYLSPQQNSFLHAAHALHSAAAASAVSAASPYFPLLAPPTVTTVASTPSTSAATAATSASTSRGETDKEIGRPAQLPPAPPPPLPPPPPFLEDASSNVVSSTMEDEESAEPCEEAARSRGKSAKGGRPVIRALASSSTGFDDAVSIKEEPDFVETHCHWVGCDREMGTQDLLVKVGEHRLLEEVYGKTFFVPFSALEQ